MLRFNLKDSSLDLPVIAEAKRMLADRGLQCIEMTWDEDDMRNSFSDLLVAELNKVPDAKHGPIEFDDYYLDAGTKGIVLYEGTTALARTVINARWKNHQTLGYVSSLTQVLEGQDVLDLRTLLFRCAEACIYGHIKRGDEEELICFFQEGGKKFAVTLVSACDKGDDAEVEFIERLGFEATDDYYTILENLVDYVVPYEKELDITALEGSLSYDEVD